MLFNLGEDEENTSQKFGTKEETKEKTESKLLVVSAKKAKKSNMKNIL